MGKLLQWARFTELACLNEESTEVFEYPDQDMTDKYMLSGVIPYITGFLNDRKDGKGPRYNVVMSNGDRS
jgi:hypothetical protein